MFRSIVACGVWWLVLLPQGIAHDQSDDSSASIDYAKTSEGTKVIGWEGSDVAVKILLEPDNLGGPELEIGEITFPPKYEGQAHIHGAVEVFYPLSGDFEHWVEGQWHPVPHGSLATVRPGDQVIHRCASDIPCKLLVVWGPSGEIGRLQPDIVTPIGDEAR